MVTIKNQKISIGVDEKGSISHLENSTNSYGNVIEHPVSLFMLNIQSGNSLENPVYSEDQNCEVKKEKDSIIITFYGLYVPYLKKQVSIDLKLRISLENSYVLFQGEISNKTSDYVISDFEYPRIGAIKTLGKRAPDLLWPVQTGQRYDNIGEYLEGLEEHREAYPHSISTNYPGSDGSMQWMALTDDSETLYFACHDDEFYSSNMRVEGSKEDKRAVSLVFDKLIFVKQKEVWQSPTYVLGLYTGTWHEGAREYGAWSDAWMEKEEKPEWVKKAQGYFLVINKQQYGHEMWTYDRLPELYKLAQAHGCDILGLFGWFDSGHDNQYPDLEVSESLGGKEMLRDNINKVKEAGGYVTLYQQGHLIDPTTKYYKEKGRYLESKSRTGLPYLESYPKAHKSSYLRNYTNKYFALSCPSCPEWQELMKEKLDFVASFDANGALFDQIGGLPPYPCFDESHSHKLNKPSLSMSAGRIKLLLEMRNKKNEIGEDFALASEHITDVYSGYLDFIHGIRTNPFQEGIRDRDFAAKKQACAYNYPELFRYTFPQAIITLRNPAPFIEKRAANYACLYGFLFELEIRYQEDCEDIISDKWSDDREYVKKLSELRRKHWDILGRGSFTDNENIYTGEGPVIAKGYKYQEKLMVVLWNDSNNEERIHLKVEEYELTGWEAIERKGTELPESIFSQEIILLRYHRQ